MQVHLRLNGQLLLNIPQLRLNLRNNEITLSVIIPTKGRVDVLQECVQALLHQSIAGRAYEIIIVDNEPDRAVQKMLEKTASQNHPTVNYLKGPDRGVSAARNLGVKNSQAEIVLIIGNDIIASDDFLAQHLRYHQDFPDNNCAVLGQTKLHPNAHKSPLMRIWGDIPYWEIEKKVEVPCWFFFTGNISFKKEFFMKYGLFDEDFQRIGFEDTEAGFRFYKHGLKIMYNKNAVAYHNHPYSFEQACRQQINHGYNFGIFIEKLKALDCQDYLPMLGERYGIVGWHHTFKGCIKSIIKKWLLHRKIFMTPLKKILANNSNPGKIAAFMYPKMFNYYTNQGYLQYKKERALS
jgi:GT2 family glycosyltransferase